MVTYIKKDIKGYYIEFLEEIDAQYWEGQIGDTFQDFLDNKWVLLSADQVIFHNEHPEASVKEVWDMDIPVHVRTLEDAKNEMIENIDAYDSSDAVNGFDIITDNKFVTAWITPEQRANYKNSLDSAELLGIEEVHPVFNGVALTITVQNAKLALAQVQIYADRCYGVTETHKAEVLSLDTIEAVDAYDYMSGYPERLTFNL